MHIIKLLLVLLAAMFAVVSAGPNSDADDPCLVHEYAVHNYGTCCAHGGYKKEGHKQVCKEAKLVLVKQREAEGV